MRIQTITVKRAEIVPFKSPSLYYPGRVALFADFSDTFAIHPRAHPFPPHERELAVVVAEDIRSDATRTQFWTDFEQGFAKFEIERNNPATEFSPKDLNLL